LLDAGDLDGACNRAYYAMFDAARAALIASGAPILPEAIRTHGGLISAFSLHLVKIGRVAVDLGRTINKAEDLRHLADYTGKSVDHEQAAWVVRQARVFVQVMRDEFMPRESGGRPEPS